MDLGQKVTFLLGASSNYRDYFSNIKIIAICFQKIRLYIASWSQGKWIDRKFAKKGIISALKFNCLESREVKETVTFSSFNHSKGTGRGRHETKNRRS